MSYTVAFFGIGLLAAIPVKPHTMKNQIHSLHLASQQQNTISRIRYGSAGDCGFHLCLISYSLVKLCLQNCHRTHNFSPVYRVILQCFNYPPPVILITPLGRVLFQISPLVYIYIYPPYPHSVYSPPHLAILSVQQQQHSYTQVEPVGLNHILLSNTTLLLGFALKSIIVAT